MKPLSESVTRTLFIDNAPGKKVIATEKLALLRTRNNLKFLSKNVTDICQRGDSFIIKKIKAVWRSMWDDKRLERIYKEEWVDWKSGSEKNYI